MFPVLGSRSRAPGTIRTFTTATGRVQENRRIALVVIVVVIAIRVNVTPG